MTNHMRSRHLQLYFYSLVFTMIFALGLGWTSAQANGLQAVLPQQSSDCRISVKAGWSPHRAQAEDTLASLAARSGVTVEELMQANCLESDVIEAGALVLTPKLGPAMPTAIPTEIPTATATEMPTALPTAAPTPTATTPAVVVVDETTATAGVVDEATATVVDEATATVVVEPTATATEQAKEDEQQPVVIRTDSTTPPSSPIGTNGLVTISLLIMGIVSALFFALQPRSKKGPVILTNTGTERQPVAQNNTALGGNFAFLIGGFVVGVVLFPMLQMPSFTMIPTWLSASAAVGLIGLLAIKEIFLGAMEWRGLNRALNFGIAPLLMIFLLSVVSRFAGMMH